MGGGHAFVRPWLGARLQSVNPDIAKALGLATPTGALVADVWPGGAAAQAGLKQGDVVTTVDGQPVTDAASLNYAISTHKAGETVKLSVRRASGVQTLLVRAEPPPASPPRDERVIAGRNPFQGATVVNLSPAVAEEVGVDPFGQKGVMVLKTGPGAAQQVGLRPGDIIRQVNGRQIRTTGDLAGAVSVAARVWQVVVERGGQQIAVTLEA
jgi:S1-C subfamily serine protease